MLVRDDFFGLRNFPTNTFHLGNLSIGLPPPPPSPPRPPLSAEPPRLKFLRPPRKLPGKKQMYKNISFPHGR